MAALALFVPSGLATADKNKRKPATTTTAGVRKADFAPNVSITLGRGFFTFQSNGLPSHSRPAFYAVPQGPVVNGTNARAIPDPSRAQAVSVQIPTKPRRLKAPVATGLGPIGVLISGAVLFNPYEAGGTPALASNFTVRSPGGYDAPFIDGCNGHPQQQGMYHYHGLPPCVTAQLDGTSGPSHIIGFALDGYPIYGDRNIKGKQIGAGKLDACNGITSRTPEFPQGIYHYVLLNEPSARSSLNCFRGRVG